LWILFNCCIKRASIAGDAGEGTGEVETWPYRRAMSSPLCAERPDDGKQVPRSPRRNARPVKCIDGAFSMGHQHLAGALRELRELGKTSSYTHSILHDPWQTNVQNARLDIKMCKNSCPFYAFRSLILAAVLALISGGVSDFCPRQIGSANCLLLAHGPKCRHAMDSVVLRRLQSINPCYGNRTWEITQMFVEGLFGQGNRILSCSGEHRQQVVFVQTT
jgi:hypothetical protein